MTTAPVTATAAAIPPVIFGHVQIRRENPRFRCRRRRGNFRRGKTNRRVCKPGSGGFHGHAQRCGDRRRLGRHSLRIEISAELLDGAEDSLPGGVFGNAHEFTHLAQAAASKESQQYGVPVPLSKIGDSLIEQFFRFRQRRSPSGRGYHRFSSHGRRLLFRRSPSGRRALRVRAAEPGCCEEPSLKHDIGRQFRRLLRQRGKHDLRNVLRQRNIAQFAQALRVNGIDLRLDDLAKRFSRAGFDVFV